MRKRRLIDNYAPFHPVHQHICYRITEYLFPGIKIHQQIGYPAFIFILLADKQRQYSPN